MSGVAGMFNEVSAPVENASQQQDANQRDNS